jgi:uncharacterized protein DUF4336
MLDPIIPGAIWFSERPVKFAGVWLRSRTTVVRLEDGGLWVHSPSEPTAAMREALSALGPVRWIVIPNRFHHLQASATARAYPEAQVVGPASVGSRNAGVKLDRAVDDPAVWAKVPELDPIALAGVPYLDETLFFHRPTGSLIGADVVLCACARDHWSWRLAARICGCYEKPKIPPEVRIFTRRRDETARALDRMLALPLKRILVAHADPIEDEPGNRLAEAWRFVLGRR